MEAQATRSVIEGLALPNVADLASRAAAILLEKGGLHMADSLARSLSDDPVIVEMTEDLIAAGVEPSSPSSDDWADFVFAAAMEYTFRGGLHPEALAERFEVAAEAVVIAHERLTSV